MDEKQVETPEQTRRNFLATIFAFTGLVLSYGSLATFAAVFLYPSGKQEARKMYLASLTSLDVGEARVIATPTGEKILLTNTENGANAYSARCPHLGCQVLWRDKEKDFFCPCHNGVFDQNGNAIDGPPAKEGKNMKQVKIKIENDSVFAWV